MIILIAVGVIFWIMAQKKGLSPILWALIAVASYFVAQLLVGFAVGYYSPYLFNSYATILVVSLVSGSVGVFITWFAMIKTAKNKDEFKTDDFKDDFSDVLDDEYLEKL
ncbi:MAG: F0F1-type ATP synthase assembly protein I [Crocinitomix sp.]|jgi:F0F1-type ATP synthase assembly protein I